MVLFYLYPRLYERYISHIHVGISQCNGGTQCTLDSIMTSKLNEYITNKTIMKLLVYTLLNQIHEKQSWQGIHGNHRMSECGILM